MTTASEEAQNSDLLEIGPCIMREISVLCAMCEKVVVSWRFRLRVKCFCSIKNIYIKRDQRFLLIKSENAQLCVKFNQNDSKHIVDSCLTTHQNQVN